MNIFKKILFSLTFIMCLSFAQTTYAADDLNLGCGVISDTSSVNGMNVDPNSFAICENDISFKMFYVIFGDLFENKLLNEVLETLVPVSQSTKDLKQIAGVSSTIASIYQAFTFLFMILYVPFLIYQTFYVIYKTQATGEFLGDKKKSIQVMAQILISVMLFVPVGNIVLFQFFIFLLSILSIKIANFFLGVFLHEVGIKTSRINVDENVLMQNATDFSKSLTSQELCKSTTSKLMLNNRLISGSQWVRESPSINPLSYFDNNNNIEEFNTLAQECLQYYSVLDTDVDFNALSKINYLRGTDNNCDERNTATFIEYFPEDFGYPHSCGTVDYSWPRIDEYKTEDSGNNDAINNYYEEVRKTAFVNSWNSTEFIKTFESVYGVSINEIVNNKSYTPQEKEKALKNIYDKYAKELLTKLNSEQVLKYEAITETNEQKTKSRILYMSHIAVANYLLGATSKIPLNFFKKNYYTKGNELYTGLDSIRNYAKDANNDLERYNCMINWKDNRDTKITYIQYSKLNNDQSLKDDFIDKSKNKMDFTCFKYMQNNDDKESKKLEFLFDSKTHIDDFMGEIKNKDNFEIEDDQNKLNALNKKNHDEHALEFIKKAEKEMLLIAGYNYAVKKAVISHLSDELKKTTDNELLVSTRQAGWAAFPSMLLTISGGMVNALQYTKSIESTASASSVYQGIGNGNYSFFAENAFAKVDEDIVKSSTDTNNSIQKNALLKALKLELIFGGASSHNLNNTSSTSSADIESDLLSMERFKQFLMDQILSPMKYIKMGGGLNSNLSLSEGLKECSESGVCLASDTHPLNALMLFGHALIAKVLEILIFKLIIDTLVGASDYFDENIEGLFGGLGKDTGKLVGALVKVGKGLFNLAIYALKGFAVILDMLSLAFYTLLGIGIFCAYFLPLIPYMLSLLLIINWYFIIFVISLISLLWLAKLSRLSENGTTDIGFRNIWSVVGKVLISPPLLTISLIFAWSLANITVYFVNMTIYSIFTMVIDHSGFISSMIGYIITYIVYIIMIFIAVQHAFQMITKFQSEITDLLGIKNIGQANESLDMERYLGAAMATKAISNFIDPNKLKIMGEKSKGAGKSFAGIMKNRAGKQKQSQSQNAANEQTANEAAKKGLENKL